MLMPDSQVSTEGDAFLTAFHEAKDAIAFALDLQLELLKATWPRALSSHPACSMAEHQGPTQELPLFKGLRLRAAIHSGVPSSIEVRYILLLFAVAGSGKMGGRISNQHSCEVYNMCLHSSGSASMHCQGTLVMFMCD